MIGRAPSSPSLSRGVILGVVAVVGLLLGGVLVAPILIFAGGGFSSESGTACSQAAGQGSQPSPSSSAKNSIPANYLAIFKQAGAKYGVPWVILAGIGKVESDDGRTNLPGVHSGSNAFGAAGPMQIGIGGASSDTWGGAPVHPAGEKVSGVATDGDGDGIDSVYDPADAVAGAAKYLLEHGVLDNVQQAIFAYNHLDSYVQLVLSYASKYASGGFTVSPVTLDAAPSCVGGTSKAPNALIASVIAFAEQQLGKPYLWGGTGPDAFDCSGLVMAAYRSAGIMIPRTSQVQWTFGPRVSPSQVKPGDLIFFAGSDGTVQSPGHVGLVIGGGKMVEAFATGFPIRIATYAGRQPIGFTRPWAHSGVSVTALRQAAG
ncbi:MAG TPA: C40 family peptidase [Streptosporangiaceae bacterium]|nr:C40 family peptidase [Streptosporangiaceae bacterium]